jgi:hypothetical protein
MNHGYPDVLICFSAMLTCSEAAGPILRICASEHVDSTGSEKYRSSVVQLAL